MTMSSFGVATPPLKSQQLTKELEACQEAIKSGDLYEVLALTSKGFEVRNSAKSPPSALPVEPPEGILFHAEDLVA